MMLNKESPVFRRFKIGTWIKGFAEEVVTLAGFETLTNKVLTSPIISAPSITSPSILVSIADHDYGDGTTDWELSADDEAKAAILTATNAGDNVNIIAPATVGRVYWVKNGTEKNLTIKAADQDGVTIATGKTAAVYGDGTDFVRLTADL